MRTQIKEGIDLNYLVHNAESYHHALIKDIEHDVLFNIKTLKTDEDSWNTFLYA